MTITKQHLIGEILDLDARTADLLLQAGMHCVGCPASRGETLEEACLVHGVDVDLLLQVINSHLAPL